MKKITLALTLLLFICAMGFAGPFVLSGSSTLEWGYAGTITDNSANYAGEIPTGDLFTDNSGEHDLGPNEFTLTLEAADEDGMIIVKAESTLDLEDWDVMLDTGEEDAFEFIEFPNVLPGMLGIWLGKNDGVSTSVTATESSTDSPEFVATLTPIDGLTAKLGFVMDQETLDYNYTATVPTTSWAYGTYTDIALSIFAEYEAMLGDEDSITVGVGTVYDTAWGKAVVDDTEDLDVADVALGFQQEKYLAQTIIAADEAITEITDTYGYATLPLGVGLDVAMGDLTAGVDFQARLVSGSDTLNIDDAGDMRAYEMPMFVGVDVGYELAAGDMTITPNVNFKYSSDFWKWGYDAGPLFDTLFGLPVDTSDGDDVWEYEGDVTEADYLARPMSANVGVDVEGIAGMIDLSLNFGYGFGDGAYDHGSMGYTDVDGDSAPTLAAVLAAQQEANDAIIADDANDKLLSTSTDAMELEVGVTVELPMVPGLTVSDDFSILNDGLGFMHLDDDEAWLLQLYADGMNVITNDLVVEYDLMVSDAVAATFFGKLMYEQVTPLIEDGVFYSLDPYLMEEMEQASKSTMSYELGVKATVSF